MTKLRIAPRAWTHARQRVSGFWADTSGAITVDWIVLTGAVVVMVVAFMLTFTTGLEGFLVALMAAL